MSDSSETDSEPPVKKTPSKKDESDSDAPPTTKRKRKNEQEGAKKKKKKAEKDEAQANGAEENTEKDEAQAEEKRKPKNKKKPEEVKKPETEEVNKKKKKGSEKQQEPDEPREKQQDDPKEKPPPAAAAAPEAQKAKPSSSKNSWTPKDETTLAKRMLEDVKANPGLNFDEKPKGDNYWNQLHEALKEKLSREFASDQIFEKSKRMKLKWKRFEMEQADATRSAKKRKHAENELYGILKQLWSSEDNAAANGAKPAASAFDSKLAAQSDGEESNGDFGGFPASLKKEALDAKGLANGKAILGPVVEATGAGTSGALVAAGAGAGGNELSVLMKNFLLETISHVSSVAGGDPVISFGSSLCAGVESLMKSYKLGFEASTGNREVRKKLLEERAADYSAMRRRLKLVLDYCELEEEVLKKKLEAM